MKTLKEVGIGESAIIKRLHGEGALKRRIMDCLLYTSRCV